MVKSQITITIQVESEILANFKLDVLGSCLSFQNFKLLLGNFSITEGDKILV